MSETEVQRSARLTTVGEEVLLTITMPAKRGKKVVANVTRYLVQDARPDPAVAWPCYKLVKVNEDFLPTGEFWFVHNSEWGMGCSCPHATFRTNGAQCKHVLACKAVGLMDVPKPGGSHGKEETQEVSERSRDR